ncbi:MAG: HPr family phosphocarrier protein [Chitinispirillaceae bacterium]|jgi:phosphocarrier protein|nr:HPr family phosphocarrier protein [Chitinispirillaceae bacterium]
MTEREITVINALGVHARPAAKIVQAANKFTSRISILKDGATADAKSIVHVMMLGANFGSNLTIRAQGDDEAAAIEAVAALFAAKFDEE